MRVGIDGIAGFDNGGSAQGIGSIWRGDRDKLSSVRIATDASGNLVEQKVYADYGEPTNKAMATQENRLK